MADFRYRVNSGPWILVENAILPYTINGILGSDIVDVQTIGDSLMNIGTDPLLPTEGGVVILTYTNGGLPISTTPSSGTIEVTNA